MSAPKRCAIDWWMPVTATPSELDQKPVTQRSPAPEEPGFEATEHRLHKSSILFILIDTFKNLFLPAVILIFSSRKATWEIYALGGAAVATLFSILSYFFYRYRLEADELVIREGVIFKNVRHIPYRRIQNLNLSRNPLHQVFDVAKVQIELASGNKPEAVINVLSMAAVAELEQAIESNSSAEKQTEQSAETSGEPILTMTTPEVVKFGMISNKALIIVGFVVGYLEQTGLYDWIGEKINLDEYAFSQIENPTFADFALYISAILVFGILFMWLLSILWALFKFHGFQLTETAGRLTAKTGLITQLKASMPKARIQLLTMRESPMHRWFRRVSITAETAGGAEENSQTISMRWLAPLLPRYNHQAFLEKVQPEIDWRTLNWLPLQQRAWRRMFKVLVAGIILGSAIVSYFAGLSGLWVLMLLVPAWFYCRGYVRLAGYLCNEQLISFKSGYLFRRESYVRINKIQTVAITESPFDRRHNMASLVVDTAGAGISGHRIYIPYLDKAEAQELQARLVALVKTRDFNWG